MSRELDVFQVIADPSRRQMLEMLSKSRMTINELAENFEISRPAVSKHVKALHQAGFIEIEDVGRARYCIIQKDGFDQISSWIEYFDQFWSMKMQGLGNLMNGRK